MKQNTFIRIIVGLVLGLALAFCVNALKDYLRDQEEQREQAIADAVAEKIEQAKAEAMAEATRDARAKLLQEIDVEGDESSAAEIARTQVENAAERHRHLLQDSNNAPGSTTPDVQPDTSSASRDEPPLTVHEVIRRTQLEDPLMSLPEGHPARRQAEQRQRAAQRQREQDRQ